MTVPTVATSAAPTGLCANLRQLCAPPSRTWPGAAVVRVGMPSPARMEVRTPPPAMERRPQNTPWMSGEMTCGVSDHWLVVQRKLGEK